MINLNWFKYENENGQLIDKIRPQTCTLQTLRKMIEDGRPEKAITAYKQFLINGYIWGLLDAYNEAVSKYNPEDVEQEEPTFNEQEEPTIEWVDAQIADLISSKNKAKRTTAVNEITVEIDGMIFDGDEVAQGRMDRASRAMEKMGQETTRWKLADNTFVDVTAEQLTQAIALAGQKQTEIWEQHG